MARACSVCRSKHLVDVDRALNQGEPYRVVASRFELGPSAIFRHRKDHLSTVAHSQQPLPPNEIEGLKERLEAAECRIVILAKGLLNLSEKYP